MTHQNLSAGNRFEIPEIPKLTENNREGFRI